MASGMQAESIAEIEEPRLVELVYGTSGLVDFVGTPPLTNGPIDVRLRVLPGALGLLPGAFGDVDSLVLSAANPAEARAIEFKRVKIPDRAFDSGTPNKLSALKKAVRQANQDAAAGFAWVWLSIVVVTDSRLRSSVEEPYKTAPKHIVDRIRTAIRLESLDPDVGVYFNEIAQVADSLITGTRVTTGCMLRAAKRRKQPPRLTQAIARLFKKSAGT